MSSYEERMKGLDWSKKVGEEIYLIVGEDVPKDKGKGIVRLDKEARKAIGAKVGDYAEILAPYTRIAVVEDALPEDAGKKAVRISADLRTKLPMAIGVEAAVRKAAPWTLKRIEKETWKAYLEKTLKEPDRIEAQVRREDFY